MNNIRYHGTGKSGIYVQDLAQIPTLFSLEFAVQVAGRMDLIHTTSIRKSNSKPAVSNILRFKKKNVFQSGELYGYYWTLDTRGRLSPTASLLQWTACACLESEAENGPLLLRLAAVSCQLQTSMASIKPFIILRLSQRSTLLDLVSMEDISQNDMPWREIQISV